MASTHPTFFRRFEVFVALEVSKKSIRLEPIKITLGFSGPVDPESGMIVNLTDIDQWITDFKKRNEKKKYSSKWSLCERVKSEFTALISKSEFKELRFQFHDLEVHFKENDVILKWNQQSQITSKTHVWLSATTLTMGVDTKVWPPLSSAAEKKIQKSLSVVSLSKMNWTHKNLVFLSFEYIDPKLNIKIKTI